MSLTMVVGVNLYRAFMLYSLLRELLFSNYFSAHDRSRDRSLMKKQRVTSGDPDQLSTSRPAAWSMTRRCPRRAASRGGEGAVCTGPRPR